MLRLSELLSHLQMYFLLHSSSQSELHLWYSLSFQNTLLNSAFHVSSYCGASTLTSPILSGATPAGSDSSIYLYQILFPMIFLLENQMWLLHPSANF